MIARVSQRGRASAAAEERRRRDRAERLLQDFLERLRAFTVLDPACGSGNFLYLALQALKDLEHQVQLEAQALGLERQFPTIGPANVKGIEINPYAAELARVSVWIGEIQWMLRNGFAESRDPILQPLDTIECRDAVMTEDGQEPDWPDADVVIGNPPFLGGKLLITHLGEDYVGRLFERYAGACRLKPTWSAIGSRRRDGRSPRARRRAPDLSPPIPFAAAQPAGAARPRPIRGGSSRHGATSRG